MSLSLYLYFFGLSKIVVLSLELTHLIKFLHLTEESWTSIRKLFATLSRSPDF